MWYLYNLVNDGEDLNYGISSIPGRCTEHIYVNFKSSIIRKVTVAYSKDISNQTKVLKAWTFKESFDQQYQKTNVDFSLI
jgi:hypothetical protein